MIYLRVSTSKQADKDIDPEGYSLPAQRDACVRRAQELGAEVVEEYIDRGESAKTADRPAFLRMMARLTRQRDVDYVIVDKVNRFARNRRDDSNFLYALRNAGAQLVSVKENVDDTAPGELVHAIMAALAEYESRNNGAEALKGMTRKAQVGGTPGRAPIGYRNHVEIVDGRHVRSVAVDPERAPLVQWAFERYATGEWTTQSLTDALNEKGLRSKPVGKKPAMPLKKGRVAHLLSNPYYVGTVTFRGVQYQGRHEPLIDLVTFNRVQDVLAAKNRAGEKTRQHLHYLKGSVYCGECRSRLVFSRNTGKGGTYDYFKCMGGQLGIECPIRYVRADWLEDEVEREWERVRFGPETVARLASAIETELSRLRSETKIEATRQQKRLSDLDQERTGLLRAHLHDAVPLDLLKREQDRIAREISEAQAVLNASNLHFADIEATLRRALMLTENCHRSYCEAGPVVRRLFNQAFFERLEVHTWGVHGQLASPFRELRAIATQLEELDAAEVRITSGEGGSKASDARQRRTGGHRRPANMKNPGGLCRRRGWNMNDLVPPA
ncbi:MAG: recombinase family protein [Acidimicrobiia bacterium]